MKNEKLKNIIRKTLLVIFIILMLCILFLLSLFMPVPSALHEFDDNTDMMRFLCICEVLLSMFIFIISKQKKGIKIFLILTNIFTAYKFIISLIYNLTQN
jgi:peptidoglycan/LPS O-acetylase OafA/YrhL